MRQCEAPEVGAGNRTLVLCKNSESVSALSTFSNLCLVLKTYVRAMDHCSLGMYMGKSIYCIM